MVELIEKFMSLTGKSTNCRGRKRTRQDTIGIPLGTLNIRGVTRNAGRKGLRLASNRKTCVLTIVVRILGCGNYRPHLQPIND